MSITYDEMIANRTITSRDVTVSSDPYVYASEFAETQLGEPAQVIVKESGVPVVITPDYEANSGNPRLRFYSDLSSATIIWL